MQHIIAVDASPAPTPRRRKAPFNIGRMIIHFALILLSLAFLYPLVLVLSVSLTDEKSLGQYGYALIPHTFSAYAYQYIFRQPGAIIQAYSVSLFVTVAGSAISLLLMSMLAYVLSRKDFFLRKPLAFYVFFTMLFNGGLVPFYILVTNYLHLQDTIQVLILPYLIVPWYVLLLRTYFAGLPKDLLDAAKVDGAGEWRIFLQVVVPLSTPALATVGLFSMLLYWNDWWLALLFINDPHLNPVQYLLYQVSTNIDVLSGNAQLGGIVVPTLSARMALAVLAIAPITLAFFFVRRYFVRGITLGGVKDD